jgi:hypothetical protein
MIRNSNVFKYTVGSIVALLFLVILENVTAITITFLLDSLTIINPFWNGTVFNILSRLLITVLFVPILEELYKYLTCKGGFGFFYTLIFSTYELFLFMSRGDDFSDMIRIFYLRIIPFIFHFCTFFVIYSGVVQSSNNGNRKMEYTSLFIAIMLHSIYNFVVLTMI